MHGWWWHLFNDPMRSNLWSLVALGVILVLGGIALVVLSYVRWAAAFHRVTGHRFCPRCNESGIH